MKKLIGLQLLISFATLISVGIFFCIIGKQVPSNVIPNNSTQVNNIATLYALDPLAHSFCFADGKYGENFASWSVYNRRSDIDFNSYYNGSFSVGIEGAVVGTIIDLGTSAHLQQKYKYEETGGDGQGFASIHRENKTILILKNVPYQNTFQRMDESAKLFQEGTSVAHTVVNLGHLYLIRSTDHTRINFEQIVKMLVIAYQPNESVTIRWEVLN